jgi:argininosuccinate synthase
MPENSTPASPDPMTALLVALTKIDGKLDTSLAVQALHSQDIASLRTDVGEHGRKIVALETARATDGDHAQRMVSSRAAFWASVVALATVIGLIVTLFVSTHGG